MIFILFTPLVKKWELLIIIKHMDKEYGGNNCLHFIHKFSLICILYLSQQKLFES